MLRRIVIVLDERIVVARGVTIVDLGTAGLGVAHALFGVGRHQLSRLPVTDLDQLQAPTPELQHGAVAQRGGVDRGQVAQACLLLF